MRVEWTETARNDLTEIHRRIAESSTAYAQRTIDRLIGRSNQIGDFPLSGRVVPEFGLPQIREVIERPYRIVYHIKPDCIDVVAVIHVARDALHDF